MEITATTMESNMEIPQKLKIALPHNSVISRLGTYPKECVSEYVRATCTPILLQYHLQYPSFGSSPDAPQLMNGLRKCGIHTHGVLVSHKEQ
jgi:hypothetical protein